LLLPLVLVFLLSRKWRAFGIAVAIPAVLNAVAFAVVADPNQVWSKLPSLLNRSGSGTELNSAWVGVLQTLGAPGFATILIRMATVAIVLTAAWWSWQQLSDAATRIITTSSILLIGAYLAGTLSEDHFMLTLVPVAMTAIVSRAPMRWFTGWIGVLWLMGLTPPGSLLGLDTSANQSAFEAFGMALVLVTIFVVLAHRGSSTARAALGTPAGTSPDHPAYVAADGSAGALAGVPAGALAHIPPDGQRGAPARGQVGAPAGGPVAAPAGARAAGSTGDPASVPAAGPSSPADSRQATVLDGTLAR
jgi:hypothetical protein